MGFLTAVTQTDSHRLDLQNCGLKNVKLVMSHHWDKLHVICCKGKSVTSFQS